MADIARHGFRFFLQNAQSNENIIYTVGRVINEKYGLPILINNVYRHSIPTSEV